MQSSPTASSLEPGEHPSSQAMTAAGGGMMQQLHASCPMAVQGADVAVSDTEGGIALTFTTDAPDVADLRARARSMAKMYDMHRGHGAMMWHPMGGAGMGHGSGMRMGMEDLEGGGSMPATSATVTDTDKGARIELQPAEASELDALRQRVRLHQERMHSGECWMPQEQPPAHGEQE